MQAHEVARLLCSCTLLFVTNAPMMVPSVLFPDIGKSFDMEEGDVAAVMSISYATATLIFSMPASLFMERFGVHYAFIVGQTMVCVLVSLQVLCPHFWQLVAMQAGVGMCHSLCNTVAFVAFCRAWFAEKPSTAIALNFAAFGMAGVIWTQAAAFIDTRYDWRTTLAIVACTQWAVGLPLALFGMYDPPKRATEEELCAFTSAENEDTIDEDGADAKWWLRDGRVWLLASMTFAVVYIATSINIMTIVFFKDHFEMSLDEASRYTSLVFFFNVVGKFMSGPLYDGQHARKFSVGALALLTLGLLMLWCLSQQSTAGTKAVVVAIILGIGYGMSFALTMSKAARHFGHRHGFKALQGFLFCWQAVGQIISSVVTPEVAQHYSYSVAFVVLICAAGVALASIAAFESREGSYKTLEQIESAKEKREGDLEAADTSLEVLLAEREESGAKRVS